MKTLSRYFSASLALALCFSGLFGISTASAISPGGSFYTVEFQPEDSDADGTNDQWSTQPYLCHEGYFSDYVLPDDELYNATQLFEVTSDPFVIGGFGPPLTGNNTMPKGCAPFGDLGQTYQLRMCAIKTSDPENDLVCNSDTVIEYPATVPEWPTEPGGDNQNYPSYGFMVGIQVLFLSSVAIVFMIVRMYSPRSRR